MITTVIIAKLLCNNSYKNSKHKSAENSRRIRSLETYYEIYRLPKRFITTALEDLNATL